ncbi:hypothetical protein NE619_15310 [Anaerovorax odorimutans]|uniref:Uncharacterized protein n=1 Tax=Anaerovorax odorimutans TaxID=109327 RepID=A0ABT1RSB5_9FIRM|nr:hypothetical protein [Anaerovorax odorimutans]
MAVEMFPRFAASAPVQSPILDQVFVLEGTASLKKAQQELIFSLRVDENSNLPFGQLLYKPIPAAQRTILAVKRGEPPPST